MLTCVLLRTNTVILSVHVGLHYKYIGAALLVYLGLNRPMSLHTEVC